MSSPVCFPFCFACFCFCCFFLLFFLVVFLFLSRFTLYFPLFFLLFSYYYSSCFSFIFVPLFFLSCFTFVFPFLLFSLLFPFLFSLFFPLWSPCDSQWFFVLHLCFSLLRPVFFACVLLRPVCSPSFSFTPSHLPHLFLFSSFYLFALSLVLLFSVPFSLLFFVLRLPPLCVRSPPLPPPRFFCPPPQPPLSSVCCSTFPLLFLSSSLFLFPLPLPLPFLLPFTCPPVSVPVSPLLFSIPLVLFVPTLFFCCSSPPFFVPASLFSPCFCFTSHVFVSSPFVFAPSQLFVCFLAPCLFFFASLFCFSFCSNFLCRALCCQVRPSLRRDGQEEEMWVRCSQREQEGEGVPRVGATTQEQTRLNEDVPQDYGRGARVVLHILVRCQRR